MLSRPIILLLAIGTTACTEIQTWGTVAAQQRRTMNDLQARVTLAATCDISVGAFFRELSDTERHYVALVCGGMHREEVDEMLAAANRRRLLLFSPAE